MKQFDLRKTVKLMFTCCSKRNPEHVHTGFTWGSEDGDSGKRECGEVEDVVGALTPVGSGVAHVFHELLVELRAAARR